MKRTVAVLGAVTLLLAGCGGTDEATPQTNAGTASESAPSTGSSSPEESPTAGGTASESPTSAESSPEESAPASEQTLTGTIGTESDPDAFEISLMGPDGEPVEELKAGKYTVKVQDPSKIHNFHLEGPGVDEATEVGGTGEETFEVTLEPGEYTYVCDPHPGSMKGTFKVT